MVPLRVVSEQELVSSANIRSERPIVVDDSSGTRVSNSSELSEDVILVCGKLVSSVRITEKDSLLVSSEGANPLASGRDMLLWL